MDEEFLGGPGLNPDVIYRVFYTPTSFGYAVTPDGIGAYWYDTYEEAVHQHDEMPVEEVTEDEFEALRLY